MVRFDIDPARTVLLVVDMQNCFVADSPIAAPLGAEVAGRLNQLADTCRHAAIPVMRARRGVPPVGSNPGRPAEVMPPVAAGIPTHAAPTAALPPLMDVRPGDVVVGKPRFGSFHGTDLEVILRSRGVDTIILGG